MGQRLIIEAYITSLNNIQRSNNIIPKKISIEITNLESILIILN